MTDLNAREVALLVPLVVLMVVMGFYPKPFLDKSAPVTDHILEVVNTKLADNAPSQ